MRPLQDLFPQTDYPDLIIGLGEPDDAAVWRIDDAQSLVVTLDFFTPVVDTPYEYGAIAAANALSDLYAMGARPIFALNVAGMPANLPEDMIREIFRGGAEKVREAGAAIAGGHTIQDDEPKYGLVAIGLANQGQLITKTALASGDLLILTKPLGTGVTTTALKNAVCSEEDAKQAISWMARLNKTAGEIASELNVRGGTDITGYGFLGHAYELSQASSVALEFWLPEIPFLKGALGYAESGQFPGGSADNKNFFGDHVAFDPGINDDMQMLLFDAQTSGGLLFGINPANLTACLERMRKAEQPAWLVGEVLAGSGIHVKTRSPEKHKSMVAHTPDLMFWT